MKSTKLEEATLKALQNKLYEVNDSEQLKEYKEPKFPRTLKIPYTKKVTEAVDENLKSYTVTVSDAENQHSFQYLVDKNKTLDDVFNEIYDYIMS